MAAAAKTCTACGIDVSDKPRTKDAAGRYFCEACAAKAKQPAAPAPAARPGPAPAAVKPAVYQVDPLMEQILGSGAPAAGQKEAPPPAIASVCSACSAAMSPGATICLVCGFNTQTGKVLRTRVTAEKGAGGGGGGPKLSLGTNTDWGEVGKIAGGIFAYFFALGALTFVVPIFGLVLALSAVVYALYYMIAMIVQPFLEGRYLWGIWHLVVLLGSAPVGAYAQMNDMPELALVPALAQIPSVYYVFWLCENNRLKAMWLLTIIFWTVILVLVLGLGLAMATGGGAAR